MEAFNIQAYAFYNYNWKLYGDNPYFMSASLYFETFYLNMSMFLLYCMTYPNNRVYLMFLLPLKVKWLGIAYALLMVYQFIFSAAAQRFSMGAMAVNLLIMTLAASGKLRPRKEVKRQREFQKAAMPDMRMVAKHRCAICGRTSEDFPNLDFRFCSKCEGNYEFCPDHLFTHEHFKRG